MSDVWRSYFGKPLTDQNTTEKRSVFCNKDAYAYNYILSNGRKDLGNNIRVPKSESAWSQR